MAIPFKIEAFKRGLLALRLAALSHDQNKAVRTKSQVQFLEKHLLEAGCQTMLVEPSYTDRSFLEDYAAYYVRCFEHYRHICTRLHFFAEALDETIIANAIVADDAAQLQPHYLGFVVVKPLPLTIIGRTCLRAIPVDGGHFPSNRPQPVNLYGLKLKVDTLPFQEQDREVAACASSALWTMLYSTSRLFQHAMPSPVEITKAATMHARVNGRTFPNGDGLNTLQMADAIRSVGLEPFVLAVSSMPRVAVPVEDFGDAFPDPAAEETPAEAAALAAKMRLVLKLSVLAYLRSGIACVLLSRTSDERNGERLKRGNHAVAITGYSLGEAEPEGYGETRFKAGRIDKLYVHDDQTGPFTTYAFDEGTRLHAVDFRAPDVDRRFAEPINLLVPLYHKIRIPIQHVVDITVALDEAIEGPREKLGLKQRIEWDIELVGLEALRDEIARSSLSQNAKLELLTLSLPRFVWRVRALYKNAPLFDLLIDATDLLQGHLVRKLVVHDEKVSRNIATIFALSGNLYAETLNSTLEAFKAAFPRKKLTSASVAP